MITIGEGSLAIPAHWHNASVNIFSATSTGGLSLTVNRDRLGPGIMLADYAQQQIETLPQQLARWVLLQQQVLLLAEHPGHLFEFTWHAPAQGLIHQILLCTAQDATVLNFSGTHTGMMDQQQRQQILTMLTSFRFNA